MTQITALEVLLALYGFAIIASSGYALFRLKNIPSLPKDSQGPSPLVSVIVPARNEEDTIQDSVQSLLDLEYGEKEIVVVEGNSDDRTPDALKRFGDTIEVLSEPPRPADWIGKNWACHNGYLRARGELLLFTDADTIHAPDSLRRSVSYLLSQQVDMVSILPRLEMRSRWEKVMLPFVGHLIILFYGGPSVNDDNRSKFFANGQYILIKRSVYDRIHGHARVAGEILEDIGLARVVKREGFRVRVLYGAGAFRTKMYGNWSELWEGFVKNTFPAFRFDTLHILAAIGILLLAFLVPFPTFYFSLRNMPPSSPANFLLGLACLSIVGRMLAIYFKAGAGLRYGLLFPAAVILEVMIMTVSAFRILSGRGIRWKGRLYSLRT